MNRSRGPAITFLVYTVLVAFVLALELRGKRPLLGPYGMRRTIEESSGIIPRAFATWIVPLFRVGYSNTLTLEDLTEIPAELSFDQFKGSSRNEVSTTGVSVDAALSQSGSLTQSRILYLLWKTHSAAILQPVLPRACHIALTIAQAFLIQRATAWISEPITTNTYRNGGGLIAAYVLVYVGIAVRAYPKIAAAYPMRANGSHH